LFLLSVLTVSGKLLVNLMHPSYPLAVFEELQGSARIGYKK
jgi:hypothetical protein